MLIIQLILTYLLLNTEIGLILIRIISSLFTKLLEYAADGINFVFMAFPIKVKCPFSLLSYYQLSSFPS
ncbi:Na+ dependent nucleoside transporter N-terminal domain-containing protein [Bacillus paranthracis]